MRFIDFQVSEFGCCDFRFCTFGGCGDSGCVHGGKVNFGVVAAEASVSAERRGSRLAVLFRSVSEVATIMSLNALDFWNLILFRFSVSVVVQIAVYVAWVN